MIRVYDPSKAQRYNRIYIEAGNIPLEDLLQIFNEADAVVLNDDYTHCAVNAVKSFYPGQFYPRVHMQGDYDEINKLWGFTVHVDLLPHGGSGMKSTRQAAKLRYPDPDGLISTDMIKPFVDSITSRIIKRGYYAHYHGTKF